MNELIDDTEGLEVGEFYLVEGPSHDDKPSTWFLHGAIVEYLGERKVKIISMVDNEMRNIGGSAFSKFRIGGTIEISSKGFLKYRKL